MRKEAELDDVWREKKNNPDQGGASKPLSATYSLPWHCASDQPATALCLFLCSPSDGSGYVLAFSWRRRAFAQSP